MQLGIFLFFGVRFSLLQIDEGTHFNASPCSDLDDLPHGEKRLLPRKVLEAFLGQISHICPHCPWNKLGETLNRV